jgi:hypothetical protein
LGVTRHDAIPVDAPAADRIAPRRATSGGRVAGNTDTDDDATAFACAAIGSVSALELLILLRRERHNRYRVAELVRELRSSQIAVGQALDHLIKFGLVAGAPDSGYHYQQGSAQLDAICERVEAVYARKPVSLIRALLDAPDEKLRQFADAFRIAPKEK